MMEKCAICQDYLPREKKLRRSSRIRERSGETEEEDALNLVQMDCCLQYFHATCFVECLKVDARCPLCRFPFFPVQQQQTVHYHQPVEPRMIDWYPVAVLVFSLVILTWTFYFMAVQFYDRGILYIAQMFGAVIVNIVLICTAGQFLKSYL